MVDALNKIVSMDAFRATRDMDRSKVYGQRRPASLNSRLPRLTGRSIEHRERMLQFLRTEAARRSERAGRDGAQEVQGRLLL